MRKKTVRDVVNEIGRDRIANVLGVKQAAISNVVVSGAFPTSWYMVVKDLADETGAEAPDYLFKFKKKDLSNSIEAASL